MSSWLLGVLLIVSAGFGVNAMESNHLYPAGAFTMAAFALWLLLRGKPRQYLVVACIYETVFMTICLSVLFLVPNDELRILFAVVNVAVVYILLGQCPGLIVTLVSAVGLPIANHFLKAPYSPNALASLLIGIAFFGVLFYAFGDRSISHFHRMRQYNEALRHLAMRDSLTGIYNSRAYYAECNQLIRLSERQGTPFAVLFVDLDHFKSINDRYGHAAGDMVLKAVAESLEAGMRDSDLLGRVGGEEFSVFLFGAQLQAALELAERLHARIEALMPESGTGQRVNITASIGIAESGENRQSMEAIQQLADQAMYLAKQDGRNRVSWIGTGERMEWQKDDL
jgi:diguanylate cyclase (GGDEF)-like protein